MPFHVELVVVWLVVSVEVPANGGGVLVVQLHSSFKVVLFTLDLVSVLQCHVLVAHCCSAVEGECRAVVTYIVDEFKVVFSCCTQHDPIPAITTKATIVGSHFEVQVIMVEACFDTSADIILVGSLEGCKRSYFEFHHVCLVFAICVSIALNAVVGF